MPSKPSLDEPGMGTPKYNPANERLKRRYYVYLREARQLGEHTIDQAAKALDRFESYTKRKPLGDFRTEQAIGFKRKLGAQNAVRSGAKLSKATVTSTLNRLREFFQWLANEPGYQKRIRYNDADFFRPSRSDEAIARAPRRSSVPTRGEVRAMIAALPAVTDIDRRDRAVIAIAMLTGARDNALASLKLGHLDFAREELFQDGRDVRTKFSSTFPTTIFPVGEDFEQIAREWKALLETKYGFGPEDPLFPKTEVTFGADGAPVPPRLARIGWANADPIRAIFKRSCLAAGLPHYTPHSLRHTLTTIGQLACETPHDFAAWSQNLGHKGVLVTLTSYGKVPEHAQRLAIRGLAGRIDKVDF